jgi:hypothetical protein
MPTDIDPLYHLPARRIDDLDLIAPAQCDESEAAIPG